MAYNLSERLDRLRARRFDPDVFESVDRMLEAYQKRSSDNAMRYALGSMQEVGQRSTEISLEEAGRVELALKSGLVASNLYPSFRLQGSVPLNTHIKGVSDVDLLCIEQKYLHVVECKNSLKTYLPYTGRGEIINDILFLRENCETVLKNRYWSATVDTSPKKSISLSGGAFRRKVDVVPSSWFDNEKYQTTLIDHFRGIEIADKASFDLIRNYPFLFRSEIERADALSNGGTKMGIRLIKNLKNDSSLDLDLSSFDIGSIMFSCPTDYILYYHTNDLGVLVGIGRWLEELSNNREMANNLETPDKTRKILDSTKKFTDIVNLASELNQLIDEVLRETGQPRQLQASGRSYALDQLKKHDIPMVA